jgi:FkbH-like protein
VGRKAEAAKAEASSLEDYLRGLEQRLVLSFVGRDTLVRVAQMHQRTNQFNLTTRRLTESDIAGIAGDEGRGIVVLGKVSDRFGDHGIVIVATVIIHEREAVIHTLLMSCRVIGREVERAFLGELLRELRQRGVTQVRGDYIPTAKNAMVRDFYENAGFTASRSDDEGATAWSLTIGKKKLPASKFVTVSWET